MKKLIYSQSFFLIGFILSLSLLWPLFAAPYFSHHDDVQVIRLYEMDKCFKDRQIPCRWVPDLGGQYGYPIFNYYAPLPYYFGELIYFITGSLLTSVKVMLAFSFLGSFVFMYLLGRKLWGNMGGALSAVLYSFAPYHAVDFYVRGAMGEMWAFMAMPAVLWGILKLEKNLNILNLLILASSVAILIMSHNLSAMIFLPAAGLLALFLFLRKRQKSFLFLGITGGILGLALSAFYLFPAIFEKNLVHVDTTIMGYFSYTEHFKGFRKLFLDTLWRYGSSIREVPGGERDGLSYQIGWIHLISWLTAVGTAFILLKRKRKIALLILLFSGFVVLSVFLIHPRSEFIWKVADPLKYLQFPWRFLLLVAFFISVSSGALFLLNFKNKKIIWGIFIAAAVIANFSKFAPERFIDTSDEMLLGGKDWDKQIKRSIFDFLPVYAKEPPAELAWERYEILTGESKIYDFKQGTDWFSFNAQTFSHTIIRLSQYYFPDWRIYIDGVETKLEYNNNLGLMTLILGPGNHTVWGRLYDTPVRTIGNFISFTAAIVAGILFMLSFERVRNWIRYYRKRMN